MVVRGLRPHQTVFLNTVSRLACAYKLLHSICCVGIIPTNKWTVESRRDPVNKTVGIIPTYVYGGFSKIRPNAVASASVTPFLRPPYL